MPVTTEDNAFIDNDYNKNLHGFARKRAKLSDEEKKIPFLKVWINTQWECI